MCARAWCCWIRNSNQGQHARSPLKFLCCIILRQSSEATSPSSTRSHGTASRRRPGHERGIVTFRHASTSAVPVPALSGVSVAWYSYHIREEKYARHRGREKSVYDDVDVKPMQVKKEALEEAAPVVTPLRT